MSQGSVSETGVQDIEQRREAAARHPELGIYMDHNATTPLATEALDAMLPYLTWSFGNASSIHEFGIHARYGIEKARMQVARLINAADPEHVVFTGCGSESDNIAIRGAAQANPSKRHVITTAVEHKAILESCAALEEDGYEITYLAVDADCKVTPQSVADAIRPETLIVSVMFANNETGVVQPIAEIARVCRERGVLFHTDAVQAAGRLPIDVQELGVDMLSMSGHKLYGLKGVGGLYIKPGTPVRGLIGGGAQEMGIRAGTENVAGIVAFGRAAKLAGKGLAAEAISITKLRRNFFKAITDTIEGVRINGHLEDRLPGTLNMCFAGISGPRLVTEMNSKGVAISAGSACTSVGTAHSHVLLGMGMSKDDAAASVRISLGRSNTPEHVETVMKFLPGLIANLREEFKTEGHVDEAEC